MSKLAKPAAFCLALHLALSWAAGTRADEAVPRVHIVAGSELDYPPYATVTADGQADGFSVDLMKAVCEAMGIDVTFRVGPWSEVRSALERGEIDALPLVSYSKEREKVFDFTMPHTVADAIVFKRRATPAIDTVMDLRDKPIVVMRSDAAHDWLVRNDISNRLVFSATLPEAFRLLAAGRADYLLAPRLVGLLTVLEMGLSDIETTGPLIDAYGRGYGFAVKKGNTALLLKLNEGLSVVRQSGRYDQIYAKWFGVVDPKGVPAALIVRYVLVGLAGVGVLGAVAFVWIVTLRKTVRRQTTELRRARDELEERVDERTATLADQTFILNAVINGSSNGIYVKDRAGRFMLVNRVKAEHLGFKPEEIVGKSDRDFFPPDVAADRLARDREVVETGVAADAEEVIPFKGKTRLFQAYRTPYRDGKGNIVGVIGIARDISERKAAEQKLASHQRLLETIIETIPHGIFWKNRDLTYAGCNSRAIQNWGLDRPDQVIGKTVFDLARDREEAEMLTRADRVVIEEGKSLLDFEDTHVRPDGTMATHLSSKLPLRDEAGNVTGLLCIFLDISERLAAERQLRHAQRAEALSSLAGGMAHELNNLLLPIVALAKMAEKRAPENSPERMRLSKIVEAGERAADIVGQILTFSRDEDEERSLVDLRSVADEAAKLLKATLVANVAFKCSLSEDVGVAKVVAGQIQTAILNLATNAAEALEGRPGEVVLSLERIDLDRDGIRELPELQTGPHARISVRDSGKGIPAEIIDRVFDPFFTTKEVGAGVGMGLATVNAVARRHDGAVRIASTPGKGTQVDLYLPLATGGDEGGLAQGVLIHVD